MIEKAKNSSENSIHSKNNGKIDMPQLNDGVKDQEDDLDQDDLPVGAHEDSLDDIIPESNPQEDQEDLQVGKELYGYQKEAIERIFSRLKEYPKNYNLLYQLPTGGGKTVIFSQIARRYIQEMKQKVLILTHRIELCGQTSRMLDEFAVRNKIINSKVKEIADDSIYDCFVAMVETLNNRLQDEKITTENVGLVIVDEAHYNSFRKLFQYFKNCVILGVTATPLSSNIKLPMKDNYNELIVGNSIAGLIEKGFLAKAFTYSYDVRLGSLKIGMNGDYTVSSSERLYSELYMQEKLLGAYEQVCKDKKTLIFNNGIRTSLEVLETFKRAGYGIKHLDNSNSAKERRDILQWFKEVPNAILTSVGILTTGFDEPSVENIILNRATKSLTLYHQMIGRGSRILGYKKSFNVVDLGNNAYRFGLWDAHVDWHEIFRCPDFYLQNVISDEDIERNITYSMPEELKEKFSGASCINFDVKEEYKKVKEAGLKANVTIERSILHHAKMCVESSVDVYEALSLAKELAEDIDCRVKHYANCLITSSDNYIKWLKDEYERKLRSKIRQLY